MRFCCFILCFLALQADILAQKGESMHLYTGIEVSPGQGFRKLQNPNSEVFIDELIDRRNELESPVQNISAGLMAGLSLTNSVQVGIGFRYATKGYQQKLSPDPFDTLDPIVPESIHLITRTRFIEIPVRFTYILYRPKQQYFATAEIYWTEAQTATSILYKRFPDGRQRDKNIEKIQNNYRFLGAGLQLGLQNMVTEHIALRFSPGFRMDLIDFSSNDLHVLHWNASANFSLIYHW